MGFGQGGSRMRELSQGVPAEGCGELLRETVPWGELWEGLNGVTWHGAAEMRCRPPGTRCDALGRVAPHSRTPRGCRAWLGRCSSLRAVCAGMGNAHPISYGTPSGREERDTARGWSWTSPGMLGQTGPPTPSTAPPAPGLPLCKGSGGGRGSRTQSRHRSAAAAAPG